MSQQTSQQCKNNVLMNWIGKPYHQVMQSEFPHSSLWMQSPVLSSDWCWKMQSKLAEHGGWQPLLWCPIEKVRAPMQLLSACFPKKSLFSRMPLKAAGSPRQVASPQGEGSPIRLRALRSSISLKCSNFPLRSVPLTGNKLFPCKPTSL